MSGSLIVTEVKYNSIAENAGVLVDDIIWKYNDIYIDSDKTLIGAIEACKESASPIKLEVLRGSDSSVVCLEVSSGPLGIIFSHPVKSAIKKQQLRIYSVEHIPNIREYLGIARGSTVRGKNAISDIGASLKNLVGGELKAYTQLMADAREQAIYRMQEDALQMGANAVIGVRFTSSTIDVGAAEICAYGTAVVIAEPSEDSNDD